MAWFSEKSATRELSKEARRVQEGDLETLLDRQQKIEQKV